MDEELTYGSTVGFKVKTNKVVPSSSRDHCCLLLDVPVLGRLQRSVAVVWNSYRRCCSRRGERVKVARYAKRNMMGSSPCTAMLDITLSSLAYSSFGYITIGQKREKDRKRKKARVGNVVDTVGSTLYDSSDASISFDEERRTTARRQQSVLRCCSSKWGLFSFLAAAAWSCDLFSFFAHFFPHPPHRFGSFPRLSPWKSRSFRCLSICHLLVEGSRRA